MSRPVLYLVAFAVFILIVTAGTVWAMRRSRAEVERHHRALEYEDEESEDGDDT